MRGGERPVGAPYDDEVTSGAVGNGPTSPGGTGSGAVGGAPGHRVDGRYVLERELGRGGMGVVWEALDTRLERRVAVKELLLRGAVDEEERAHWVARARREAQAIARVGHEHVVTVHDVIEAGGQIWIVMERVGSRSLADLVREQGRLPVREAARIGSEVLRGLREVHEAGVLHRDVKPHNVLFRRDGRAVLMDFGVATFEGASQVTQVHEVVGTPRYLAPELAVPLSERSAGAVAAAADVWSVGVMLFEMTEGRAPFRDPDPFEVLVAVRTAPVPAMPHAGPLAPLIEQLLTKDPQQRITGRRAEEALRRIAVRGDEGDGGGLEGVAGAVAGGASGGGSGSGVGSGYGSGPGFASRSEAVRWAADGEASPTADTPAPRPTTPLRKRSGGRPAEPGHVRVRGSLLASVLGVLGVVVLGCGGWFAWSAMHDGGTGHPAAGRVPPQAPVSSPAPPPPSGAPAGPPKQAEPYTRALFRNAATGMCADLPGEGPGMSGIIDQSGCNPSPADNQLWDVTTPHPHEGPHGVDLVMIANSKDRGRLCLDLPGGAAQPVGTTVAEGPCNANRDDNQLWWLDPQSDGTTLIRNAAAGDLCLGVAPRLATQEGAPLSLVDCAPASRTARWHLPH
ncbi:serine/threonine protein kinase [Streptomyces sp. NPDC050161]|uniref:serine/threonine protein kinase n=1 Tax=Streptomyces sp. NPDC050161 TaxID=3365604 RepID=UPI00379FEE60